MTEKHNSTRLHKTAIALLTALVLAFMCLSILVCMKSGLLSTLLIKVGIKEDVPINKDAYKSWSNCLEQLNIDADIVFIGDSITANGNFQSLIQDKTVCNLGCYGDQIWDVTARINAVKAVKPETIYIMIGTNSLACRTLEQAEKSYSVMADTYAETFPESRIVFLSVLPVTPKLEDGARTNTNISVFNDFVQATAKKHGTEYIDLFSLYVLDGGLNPQYTEDGLHITQDAYSIWVDAISK